MAACIYRDKRQCSCKKQGLNLFYMGKVRPHDGNAVRSIGIGYAYGWMIGRLV